METEQAGIGGLQRSGWARRCARGVRASVLVSIEPRSQPAPLPVLKSPSPRWNASTPSRAGVDLLARVPVPATTCACFTPVLDRIGESRASGPLEKPDSPVSRKLGSVAFLGESGSRDCRPITLCHFRPPGRRIPRASNSATRRGASAPGNAASNPPRSRVVTPRGPPSRAPPPCPPAPSRFCAQRVEAPPLATAPRPPAKAGPCPVVTICPSRGRADVAQWLAGVEP